MSVLKYKHVRQRGNNLWPPAPGQACQALDELALTYGDLDRCQSELLAGAVSITSGHNIKDAASLIKRSTNVYFVLAEAIPAIKIGRTDDLALRLSQIQVCSPVEVRLVASVRAEHWLEPYLHRLLAASRIRGEWFRCDDQVLQVVEAAADTGLVGVVDLVKSIQISQNMTCAASEGPVQFT